MKKIAVSVLRALAISGSILSAKNIKMDDE